MAKFNATVEFSLNTEIEPEGIRFGDVEDVEGVGEFEDQSYLGAKSVRADGGSLSFEITADDRDAASDLIGEALFEGQEREDDNGFTWLVEDISIDLEEIEEELTVPEAIQILSDFVDGYNDQYPQVAKAATVVLEDHSQLGRRVDTLEQRIEQLTDAVNRLSTRLSDTTESV